MKSFGPKNFQIPCTDQKVPFWQFFRKGRDGRALIVWPSRIPHRNTKILFALGADEFLVIREAPFFKVQSGKITVWACFDIYVDKAYLQVIQSFLPEHLSKKSA